MRRAFADEGDLCRISSWPHHAIRPAQPNSLGGLGGRFPQSPRLRKTLRLPQNTDAETLAAGLSREAEFALSGEAVGR